MEIEVYQHIKQSIKSAFNINLDYYKDEQMRRRLDSWLVRSGAPNWDDYFRRVRSDEKEWSRFRDYLTINVSAFFRDIERWQSLREKVVPELFRQVHQLRPTNPVLKIWSAGCSIGAEPYTLAIMMEELATSHRHKILATDFDRGALAKSMAGGPYTADEIQNLSAAQRATHLQPGGPPHFVKPGLKKSIEFREHNMLTDPFPNDFDLIVCRNVVIYFTADAKDMLYKKFVSALRPGGVIFVGATEIIPRPPDLGLRSFGISFYQKV